MSEQTVTLNLENFQQIVLEQSKSKIVVVYFWAPWDEPSVQMLSALEGVCDANSEHLLLTTVNCDEQPEIVGQFQVRSLPTTMLIKDGQPIDGFAGAQTPEQLQETFAKHLPSAESMALAKAVEVAQAGDMREAYTLAKQAFDLNPDNIDSRFLLADCAVETGQLETSKTLMESVRLADQDARYTAIMGKIELAEKAAESPEILALQAELAQRPDDFELKVKLAVQLQQAQKAEQALELLFEVLSKDLNYGDAKKLMLDMINALPDGEPLKSKYRRKVYSLLY